MIIVGRKTNTLWLFTSSIEYWSRVPLTGCWWSLAVPATTTKKGDWHGWCLLTILWWSTFSTFHVLSSSMRNAPFIWIRRSNQLGLFVVSCLMRYWFWFNAVRLFSVHNENNYQELVSKYYHRYLKFPLKILICYDRSFINESISDWVVVIGWGRRTRKNFFDSSRSVFCRFPFATPFLQQESMITDTI